MLRRLPCRRAEENPACLQHTRKIKTRRPTGGRKEDLETGATLGPLTDETEGENPLPGRTGKGNMTRKTPATISCNVHPKNEEDSETATQRN